MLFTCYVFEQLLLKLVEANVPRGFHRYNAVKVFIGKLILYSQAFNIYYYFYILHILLVIQICILFVLLCLYYH